LTIENVILVKNLTNKTIILTYEEELIGKTIKSTEVIKPSEENWIDFAHMDNIKITFKEEDK